MQGYGRPFDSREIISEKCEDAELRWTSTSTGGADVIRTNRGTAVLSLAVSIALLTACSDSKSVGDASVVATTEATTASVDSVATTDAATTSIATTTTSTAPTTTVVAIDELVLRDAGVGIYDLGAEAEVVLAGLSDELGLPTSDATVDYVVADGVGAYTTADGDVGFVAPIGRTVCWSVNLCAEFGGASVASMSFTGWSYANDPTAALSSVGGGTVGARWSDLPELDVDDGGCYSVGSGTIDGIRVTLESSGDPFGSFDDAGNYVIQVPSPADVTIIAMETGKTPIFLYGDC